MILRGTNEILFASSSKLALPALWYIHVMDVSSSQGVVAKTSKTDGPNSINEILVKNWIFLGRLGSSQAPIFAMPFHKEDITSFGDSSSTYYFGNTWTHTPLLTPLHNELALTATVYVKSSSLSLSRSSPPLPIQRCPSVRTQPPSLFGKCLPGTPM